jgi:hypothetical protein
MFQEMRDAHGIGSLPRILEPDLRNERTDWIVKRQAALFSKHEDCDRNETFRDGADAEQRIRPGRAPSAHVGDPEALDPFRAVTCHDPNGGAGRPCIGQNLREVCAQFFDRLRWLLHGRGIATRKRPRTKAATIMKTRRHRSKGAQDLEGMVIINTAAAKAKPAGFFDDLAILPISSFVITTSLSSSSEKTGIPVSGTYTKFLVRRCLFLNS